MSDTVIGSDGISRCEWSGGAPEFPDYHDNEWGRPVDSDRQLFEKLSLEAFQSGLSWRTILAKRENFRTAFSQFDIELVAAFGPTDVQRLCSNAGIVRHRGKIDAVINNAQRAIELVEKEGSLGTFVWRFEPLRNPHVAPLTVATSPESDALAKELKRRGWKFVGPTTVYAFLQAMGIVNDHVQGCAFRDEIEKLRDEFVRP